MTGELAENLQNASKDSLAVINEELKKLWSVRATALNP